MAYKFKDIDDVVSFTSWTDKQKVHELLRIDCVMYTNLGIDSTAKEKRDVKSKSKKIYKLIKGINEEMGKMLISSTDS